MTEYKVGDRVVDKVTTYGVGVVKGSYTDPFKHTVYKVRFLVYSGYMDDDDGHWRKAAEISPATENLDAAITLVRAEYEAARQAYRTMYSPHEGLSVLQEEVFELQTEVFKKQTTRDIDKMRAEAVQVAAMAVAFIVECCNEEVGRR